jgi:hypothetical protein
MVTQSKQPTGNQLIVAWTLLLACAIAVGLSPNVAKLAFQSGSNPETVMVIRSVVALLIIGAYIMLTSGKFFIPFRLLALAQSRADASLLDSYEPERIAFARMLIDSTDKAFRVATSPSRLVGMFRQYVMPRILSRLLNTKIGSRAFFGVISQTRINYRNSPLSDNLAGKVRGGDRLPYVAGHLSDNFEPLKSLDWQVHVYGIAQPALTTVLARHGLAFHNFTWSKEAETVGLERDAIYLVRPDGHIALANEGKNVDLLERYISEWKIRPNKRVANVNRSSLAA